MAPGSTGGFSTTSEPFCLGAEKWCKSDQLCVYYTRILYLFMPINKSWDFFWTNLLEQRYFGTPPQSTSFGIWPGTCKCVQLWCIEDMLTKINTLSRSLTCHVHPYTHAELRLNNHAMSSLQMKSQASICSVHEGCLYFLNATFVYTREHIKIQSSASKLCCHVARSCVLLQRFSWIQWGSMRTLPWIYRHKGGLMGLFTHSEHRNTLHIP